MSYFRRSASTRLRCPNASCSLSTVSAVIGCGEHVTQPIGAPMYTSSSRSSRLVPHFGQASRGMLSIHASSPICGGTAK